MHKILTLDNLYQFFVEQNKSVSFSAKENGKPIVVSAPANFEVSDDDMPGMLKLRLKVCHTLLNRNGSFISDENMKKAMPTLKYRPILADIHSLPDGTEDFFAHNMEIAEDEDGNENGNKKPGRLAPGGIQPKSPDAASRSRISEYQAQH